MHTLRRLSILAAALPLLILAAPVPLDLSRLNPGPISVVTDGATATVRWQDAAQHSWEAVFNLEPARPLIAAVREGGNTIVQNAVPL